MRNHKFSDEILLRKQYVKTLKNIVLIFSTTLSIKGINLNYSQNEARYMLHQISLGKNVFLIFF